MNFKSLSEPRGDGKRAPLIVLGAMLVLLAAIFGLGGSARSDVPGLQALRPISVLCLGVGLTTLRRAHLHDYRLILGLVGASALLPALQLVPLPAWLWHSLPGRELVAQIDQAVGLGTPWRPLSLAPPETWNALGAALVPLAVVVLAVQLPPRVLGALVALPLAFGIFGALLALAQLLGDARGGLYLFDITNHGAAVGLFANRNHQAVALACLIPLGAAALNLFWPPAWRTRVRMTMRFALAMLSLVALVPLILVTGSRAGLIVTAVALASLILIAPRNSQSQGAPLRRRWLALGATFLVSASAVAIWQERDLALERLLGAAPYDDLRVKMLPTLLQMVSDHQVWGTGLGTFERVYQFYEPAQLLAPTYVNHAHNDWIELIVTAGLPGFLLLLTSIFITIARVYDLLNHKYSDDAQPLRWAAATCMSLLALASVSDYPLRTPYLAGLFSLCSVWLFMPACTTGEIPAENEQ